MASKGNLRPRSAGRDADTDLYSVQENTGSGSNVPAFLMKLWTLVEDPSTDEIICWDPNGQTFHIYDQSRFAHEVLPYYFKHNNISSFIRQLNMYGFRKQTHPDQGGLKVERDDLEFGHMYFQRGQEQLLDMIKRKAAPVKVESRNAHVITDEVSKVLSDVTQLRGKQENLTSSLDQLKRENEALWREVASLRQKHAKQQQIVNKLIQFLLTLAGRRRTGMPGLKRKMPLMISNAPATPDASVSPTKSSRIVSDTPVDHSYTVDSPESFADIQLASSNPSTSGLVIHEISDPFDVDDMKQARNTPPVPASVTTPTSFMANATVAGNPVSAAQPPVSTANLLDQALASANIVPEPAVPNSMAVPVSLALVQPQPPMSLLLPTSQPQQILQPQPQQLLQQQSFLLQPQQPNPRQKVEVPQQQQHQQPQQKQQQGVQVTRQGTVPSKEVALRTHGTHDKPLSSTSKPLTSPKEVNDQLDLLQSDIDSLKEVLSTGQYNLDTNFLMGLFDPEYTLPVNLDSTFLENLAADGGTESESAEPHETPASGNIAGNEVLQYQPPETLPDLFDLGVITSPPPENDEEEDLPVYFTGNEAGLQTPKSVSSRSSITPNASRSSLSINAEELD
ncbi:hypothetical protein BaRGS_00011045 [Batillaria attramentaria]|uniref:HSF-type DNA-binding domain-containing protein n=1 Tax=Batillaria attramentaria TaxID=370345 RepID=A0ABD0LE89_9CAEN